MKRLLMARVKFPYTRLSITYLKPHHGTSLLNYVGAWVKIKFAWVKSIKSGGQIKKYNFFFNFSYFLHGWSK